MNWVGHFLQTNSGSAKFSYKITVDFVPETSGSGAVKQFRPFQKWNHIYLHFIFNYLDFIISVIPHIKEYVRPE